MADADEPLPLLLIGSELQKRIFRKTDYWAIANLEGTCRQVRDNAADVVSEVHVDKVHINPWDDEEWYVYIDEDEPSNDLPLTTAMPCSIIAKEAYLTKELALPVEKIVARIARCRLKANKLFVQGAYEAEGLIPVMEQLAVKEIVLNEMFHDKYKLTRFAIFKNLSGIDVKFHHLHDASFILLKARRIDSECGFLTPHVFNTLLHQWKSGEREIEHIRMRANPRFRPCEQAEDIIDGTNASVVWNASDHENSLLARHPLQNLLSHYCIYSLRKFDDIHNPLILSLSRDYIDISSKITEINALRSVIPSR